MSAVRLTFSLDRETVRRLRTTAERLRKPQSQVVREAVEEYSARVGRLSDSERAAMLRTFDRVMASAPARTAADVAAEIRDVRAARRRGGRRHSRSR
jgi:predicted transcriptional regulator